MLKLAVENVPDTEAIKFVVVNALPNVQPPPDPWNWSAQTSEIPLVVTVQPVVSAEKYNPLLNVHVIPVEASVNEP